MREQKGFSLVELLIVVAIILVLAAIAIPIYSRYRMTANETSAVASIHAINTAELTYSSTYPDVQYSPDLISLGGSDCLATVPSSSAACLIDATLAQASSPGVGKSGYYFTYASNATAVGYTLLGTPSVPGTTGVKNYYTDASNVIHFNATAQASSDDQTIQ